MYRCRWVIWLKPSRIRAGPRGFTVIYDVIQAVTLCVYIIVTLNIKERICHFSKWQIHPFISKETWYRWVIWLKPSRIRAGPRGFTVAYDVNQAVTLCVYIIVTLNIKECICHFSKWQIHPLISKETWYRWVIWLKPSRIRAGPRGFTVVYNVIQAIALCMYIIITLNIKERICHFLKWQIHPFISKMTLYDDWKTNSHFICLFYFQHWAC